VHLRVRHTTRFAYPVPVDLAVHLLHLRPRPHPSQRILAATLTAEPPATHSQSATDLFGNLADWLFHEAPHERFRLTLDAELLTSGAADAVRPQAPWEAVRDAAAADWDAALYLGASPLLPDDADARAFAAESFPPGRDVVEGLRDLARRIHAGFAFRPGATTVGTSVAQVLRERAGVCQDFSHAMIAGLRGLGLPARYVSGYLRTGGPGLRGAEASHAWVAAWTGPEAWLHLDPTNDCGLTESHVILGWGRDYADTSPVRGMLLGGGAGRLEVSVEVEPMEQTRIPAMTR
jgi:transglutaminase-like putative cysteine protease